MNITAIIAEYNPFHNGHAYQIEQAKLNNNADYCIVIMSGNFVQRGVPAFIDKYSRAQMALYGGADVVIELPTPYACSSAEGFARGAIRILNNLNCVTHLSFGSEHGCISDFKTASQLCDKESSLYQENLKTYLKNGASFPKARYQAMLAAYPELKRDNSIHSLFLEPNNILGIEYCRALSFFQSSILPTTIQRFGGHYHDTELASAFSSASAIRNSITANNFDLLYAQVPHTTAEILSNCWGNSAPIYRNDCSSHLHQMLLHHAFYVNDFSTFPDISKDFSDKIKKNIGAFTSFSAFCEQLKSKDLTSTRITRSLMYILLGLTAPKMEQFHSPNFNGYAKILGFKKNASPLLNKIKKQTTIPIISKNANASSILEDPIAKELFLFEMHASSIYASIVLNKYGVSIKNEYTTSPIII